MLTDTFRVVAHSDSIGGTVTLDVPRAPEVLEELLRRVVLVDYRPGAGICVSPHFYNTEEEVDRAVTEITDILSSL